MPQNQESCARGNRPSRAGRHISRQLVIGEGRPPGGGPVGSSAACLRQRIAGGGTGRILQADKRMSSGVYSWSEG